MSFYTRGRPMRVCDKCSMYRDSATMREVDGRFICNYHTAYISPQRAERVPIQTFPIKPYKNAKPLEPRHSFQNGEERIFNYVIDKYRIDFETPLNDAFIPNRNFATTVTASITIPLSNGVLGAGLTGIYLYGLINENRRPDSMIATARAKLQEIADWLLTRIIAYDDKPNGITSADHRWGGFDENGSTNTSLPASMFTYPSAVAGLALLRAYQVHGTPAYLRAARAVVWFCRSCQCGGRLSVQFSSSDSAGTTLVHFGAFARKTIAGPTVTTAHDHLFEPASLFALELYQVFLGAVGNETIGSPDTTTGYASSRETPVATAISEATMFWMVGAWDNTVGAGFTGLSPTTPFASYNAYPANKNINFSLTGTGSWRYEDAEAATGTIISGFGWAVGIRVLRAVLGDTAGVLALFDWLMTFGANPANVPAEADPLRMTYGSIGAQALAVSFKGTYDPTFALAFALKVRDGSPLAAVKYEATGTFYDLGATGLLAALYSMRQQAQFKELKIALEEPRPWAADGTAAENRRFYLGQIGRCGLSLQPRSSFFPYESACTGLIYRQAPKAFMGQG